VLLPEHAYHQPASLAECLDALLELDSGRAPDEERLSRVQVIAGGTDVIFNMRLRLFQPKNLVSIRRLPELQQVEQLADGSLRIGAACRLVDLADSPVIQASYPALKDAIDAVASAHVRNIGTLGGNICLETRCWYTNNSAEWRNGREGCFKTDCEQCHVIPSSAACHAINNADSPLALIALNAVLTIQSAQGSRDLPIADFYRRDGIAHMALESGELVTHVTVPACKDRSVFIKFTPRKGMDFSLGAVAARCGGSGEQAINVSVVIGSVSSAPIVLVEAVAILEREGLSDAAIDKAVESIRDEMGEVTNLYAKATYKKQISKVLVRRALLALREQSK
jgi:4-hydroxybenzoyl-CoA reductase subunit beta